MLVAFVKHIKYSTYAGEWQGISCGEVEKFCVEIDGVNCNNICPLGPIGDGNSGFFCVPGGILLHRHINWLDITVRHKNI